MINLTVKEKQYLKSLAHHLDPVVMIGHKGLTPQVLKEVNLNLEAHELIKVRVLGDDRETRVAMINELCLASDASIVAHIGKILVLYRGCDKITLPKK